MIPIAKSRIFGPLNTDLSGSSSAYTWNRNDVRTAMKAALRGCNKDRHTVQALDCEIHSIGDINVSGYAKEKLERAITYYDSNRHATTESFEKSLVAPVTKANRNTNDAGPAAYFAGRRLSKNIGSAKCTRAAAAVPGISTLLMMSFMRVCAMGV